MVLFPEGKFCVTDLLNPRNTEVTVFNAFMAPANKVPAKGVENEADRFNFTETCLLVIVPVFNLNNMGIGNCILYYREVFVVVADRIRKLVADVVGELFEFFFLTSSQHVLYFAEGAGIIPLNGTVGNTVYKSFHQQECIRFLIAERDGRQKITLYHEVAAVLFKADGNALFAKGLYIAVHSTDTDVEFFGDLFRGYKFFGLQESEYPEKSVYAVHVKMWSVKDSVFHDGKFQAMRSRRMVRSFSGAVLRKSER